MKRLKLFEDIHGDCYVIIHMNGGLIESIEVFEDEESSDNYIINYIHNNEKGLERYKKIRDNFDPTDLMEYWKEYHEYSGDDIYYWKADYPKKCELDKELKLRIDAKKYNL